MSATGLEVDEAELRRGLSSCLHVGRWVDDVVARAPFGSMVALLDAAAAAATPLSAAEVDEALADHPRIGERAQGSGASASFSRAEQASPDAADEALAARLAAGNAAYEAKFGRVFLVSAAGPTRSAVTTHVLDAVTGRPAVGVAVALERSADAGWETLAEARTDDDGRVGRLGPDTLTAGTYRVGFATGAWFAERGQATFYPEVVISFTLDEPGAHYHVPLLLSPYAYSTYRGS